MYACKGCLLQLSESIVSLTVGVIAADGGSRQAAEAAVMRAAQRI